MYNIGHSWHMQILFNKYQSIYTKFILVSAFIELVDQNYEFFRWFRKEKAAKVLL